MIWPFVDSCQFFYECESCKEILKPNQGDCCEFCSFGAIPYLRGKETLLE